MASMQSIKLVVVGDGAVGKTCLLISYTSNSFPQEYVPTVFDNYSANVMVDERTISLGLWDTAGQEEYDSLRPLSYPQTDVFVVCYSVISRTSFNNIKNKWIPELKHYSPTIPIVLAGLKTDLRNDEKILNRLRERNEFPVSEKEGLELSKSIGASKFIEVSSLKQTNLSELFQISIECGLMEDSLDKKKMKKNKGCSIL
eukprot:TRINITY_DN171_c0_g1_i5.p1 TRINITY_DN171_c0_g1~~TRINITY_DN171_c0_g1_i5.p1  ORF type:complete len:200 (-),score=59.36 TRINITY_DN171_c0_g1_i5:99-698(-)